VTSSALWELEELIKPQEGFLADLEVSSTTKHLWGLVQILPDRKAGD
jgi:hypothetical protein